MSDLLTKYGVKPQSEAPPQQAAGGGGLLAKYGVNAPAPEPAATAAPGMIDAAMMGTAGGLQAGHDDEVAGLIGKLKGLEYQKGRDFYRGRQKAAEAANPWTSGLSNLAGGMVRDALIPGGLLRRGAQTIAGGVEGFGRSEADNPWGLAKDTAVGLGMGALGEGAGKLISLATPTAKKLATVAQDAAVRHLRPVAGTATLLGKKKLREIGQEVLDSGALKFWNKADKTHAGIEEAMQKHGKDIENHIEGATGTTDIKTILDKIQKEVIDPLRGPEANEEIMSHVRDRMNKLGTHYNASPMTAKMVEEEKRAINRKIPYRSNNDTWKVDAEKDIARAFKEAGEGLVGAGDHAHFGTAFNKAKDSYGNLASAELMAGRTAGLADGGTGMLGKMADLTAHHAALMALLHGNPAGLAVSGVRAITKGRGASSLAAAANSSSKWLASHPNFEKLLGLGGAALEKAAPVITRQANPWGLIR